MPITKIQNGTIEGIYRVIDDTLDHSSRREEIIAAKSGKAAVDLYLRITESENVRWYDTEPSHAGASLQASAHYDRPNNNALFGVPAIETRHIVEAHHVLGYFER